VSLAAPCAQTDTEGAAALASRAILAPFHTIPASEAAAANSPKSHGTATAGKPQTMADSSLTHMHGSAILICMRTTLILDDELVEKAKELSGLAEKTAVVHAGLEVLIARESARRLAALGGAEPQLRAARRRRSPRGSAP
jgi:Arc/MetJ family transcription regulator